jgi:hypothetical protein
MRQPYAIVVSVPAEKHIRYKWHTSPLIPQVAPVRLTRHGQRYIHYENVFTSWGGDHKTFWGVTPTFCNNFFCQTRFALGCILNKYIKVKLFKKNNWAKITYHGMSFGIFLKFLENLEDFRKNPHVKIPSESPCTNFQNLPSFSS